MSVRIKECFHHAACLGASNPSRNLNILHEQGLVENNESCAHGYVGRLCHACDDGFGRETFDSCSECPPSETNLMLMVFGFLLIIAVLVIFIVFTVKTAANGTSTSSMMFKTAAAYGQVVGIASLFPYRWPSSVLALFDFLESITSVSDRILNTDCAMKNEEANGFVPLTYEKAILYMVGPMVFVAGATMFWLIVHLIFWRFQISKKKHAGASQRAMESNRSKHPQSLPDRVSQQTDDIAVWESNRMYEEKIANPRGKMGSRRGARHTSLVDGMKSANVAAERTLDLVKRKLGANMKIEWTWIDTKRYIIVSGLIAMVILHPTLTRQSLFLFMCVEIEDSMYLRKDVQLECFTEQHFSYAFLVGMPGVICYVIGTPVLTFWLLYKRKHKIMISGPAGDETRKTYGFIYRGYSIFYWEIVIMARKISMVIVAVFGLRASVQTQALMSLLVVVLATAAHVYAKPFESNILDKLEAYSLTTSFVTLYFGMFFFTRDVEESPFFLNVVTFIVLGTNAAFIVYWCVAIWTALQEDVGIVHRCAVRSRVMCREFRHAYCLKCRLGPKRRTLCEKAVQACRLSKRNRNPDEDDNELDEISQFGRRKSFRRDRTVWASMTTNGVEKESLKRLRKQKSRRGRQKDGTSKKKRALEMVELATPKNFATIRKKMDDALSNARVESHVRGMKRKSMLSELRLQRRSSMDDGDDTLVFSDIPAPDLPPPAALAPPVLPPPPPMLPPPPAPKPQNNASRRLWMKAFRDSRESRGVSVDIENQSSVDSAATAQVKSLSRREKRAQMRKLMRGENVSHAIPQRQTRSENVNVNPLFDKHWERNPASTEMMMTGSASADPAGES